MVQSRSQLEKKARRCESTVAKPLAPEEIRKHDDVAVLHVTYEFPTFLWCTDAATVPMEQPVRISFVPLEVGTVYRVESVCLPFVLVSTADGRQLSLDVRRHRLARLDGQYAHCARKRKRKTSKNDKCKR